jgi:hypothetical protein
MKIIDFDRSFFFIEIDFAAKPPRNISDSRQKRRYFQTDAGPVISETVQVPRRNSIFAVVAPGPG